MFVRLCVQLVEVDIGPGRANKGIFIKLAACHATSSCPVLLDDDSGFRTAIKC